MKFGGRSWVGWGRPPTECVVHDGKCPECEATPEWTVNKFWEKPPVPSEHDIKAPHDDEEQDETVLDSEDVVKDENAAEDGVTDVDAQDPKKRSAKPAKNTSKRKGTDRARRPGADR